jgi:hypothetical protein
LEPKTLVGKGTREFGVVRDDARRVWHTDGDDVNRLGQEIDREEMDSGCYQGRAGEDWVSPHGDHGSKTAHDVVVRELKDGICPSKLKSAVVDIIELTEKDLGTKFLPIRKRCRGK